MIMSKLAPLQLTQLQIVKIIDTQSSLSCQKMGSIFFVKSRLRLELLPFAFITLFPQIKADKAKEKI